MDPWGKPPTVVHSAGWGWGQPGHGTGLAGTLGYQCKEEGVEVKEIPVAFSVCPHV